MNSQQKLWSAIVGVVLLLIIIGKSVGGSSNDNANADSSASDTAQAAISVVPSRSSCIADPLDARIIFTVTLRNDGDAGSADVIPVRRYSDGSRNDSVMDMMSVDVPAYGTRTVWHAYDYNAESHDLLECWAQIDGKNTPLKTGVG